MNNIRRETNISILDEIEDEPMILLNYKKNEISIKMLITSLKNFEFDNKREITFVNNDEKIKEYLELIVELLEKNNYFLDILIYIQFF